MSLAEKRQTRSDYPPYRIQCTHDALQGWRRQHLLDWTMDLSLHTPQLVPAYTLFVTYPQSTQIRTEKRLMVNGDRLCVDFEILGFGCILEAANYDDRV